MVVIVNIFVKYLYIINFYTSCKYLKTEAVNF